MTAHTNPGVAHSDVTISQHKSEREPGNASIHGVLSKRYPTLRSPRSISGCTAAPQSASAPWSDDAAFAHE